MPVHFSVYVTVFDPIPKQVKEKLLQLAKTTKPAHDETDIGLIYLDTKEMQEIFSPYIKKHFSKELKFRRAWVHWMKKGGSRPKHHHSHWTYLYYLDIPKGDSGTLLFEDEQLQPVEGVHVMFPKNVKHSITPNNTDVTRWAFAAEAVPI